MLARESVTIVKQKKWFLLALFVFCLLFFSALQVIAADFFTIKVNINGVEQRLDKNTTLGSILEQMGIKLTQGALLDVEGEVIEKTGGGTPTLTVNGYQDAPLDIKLKDGDRVVAKSGKNLTEKVVEQEVSIPFGVLKKGEGTEQKVVQAGQKGLKIVSKGSISGKVVEEKVVKESVNQVVMYYTAKPSVNQKGSTNYSVLPGGTGTKAVALTFDDGPGPYTPQILNILAQYDVKATFFMVGIVVEQHPDIARMVVNHGHAIGNHTMHHRNLATLNAEGMASEVTEGAKAVKKATGVDTRVFRPPGGRYNDTTIQILNQQGYKLAMWSIDPRDWNNARSADIQQHILNHVRDGSIILLHDGGGNRQETVKALPGIISALQSRGYSFVTL